MIRWTRPSSTRLYGLLENRCRAYGILVHKVPPTKVSEPLPITTKPPKIDPFGLVSSEMAQIQANLFELLGSANPELRSSAEYYFLHPARQLRPLVVLLLSKATNCLGNSWRRKRWEAECEILEGRVEELDRPLMRPGVLESWNATMPNDQKSFEDVFPLQMPVPPSPSIPNPPNPPLDAMFHYPCLLPTQIRLAHIIEMINIASMLHDGVYDPPSSSNGSASPGSSKTNKLAILGGDFLLGRASSALSRLGEPEVVELIASVISNLAEGEITQLRDVRTPRKGASFPPETLEEAWYVYWKRTYMKTGSLLAKGARASMILGGHDEDTSVRDAAYSYGMHFGVIHQLMDDFVNFDYGLSNSGFRLATAPFLFAWEKYPELGAVLKRQFSCDGDFALAKSLVDKAAGLERTRSHAAMHAKRANEVLTFLPDTEEKLALDDLTRRVLEQTW